MSDPPLDRRLLLDVARELGWPSVTLGQLALEGECSWRRVLADGPAVAASLVERLALLRALGPHLLNAEGGAARLQAAQALPEADESPPLVEAWLRQNLAFFGDASLLPVVVSALLGVPSVVRVSLVPELAFIAVGRDSRAWYGSAVTQDRDGIARPRMIVLGPDVDAHIVRHEVGHAWLYRSPFDDVAMPLVSAQGREAVLRLAADEGWADRAARHIQRQELLAEALACLWSAP